MYACMHVCAIEILVNFVSMISLFDSMIRRSRIWYFLSLSLSSRLLSPLFSLFFSFCTTPPCTLSNGVCVYHHYFVAKHFNVGQLDRE